MSYNRNYNLRIHILIMLSYYVPKIRISSFRILERQFKLNVFFRYRKNVKQAKNVKVLAKKKKIRKCGVFKA